ncbi:MAG: nucleoside triphosphate pyrophosphohydrolase, partial [Muribaculaceae bacterium]|nr:nucleoside triphosphate pyrophosphohydrolase [Muribaculaceae bacterium]
VWEKVAEETAEVADAIAGADRDAVEAEFGDLLFSVVNAARLYGINPENALERTNRKFISRFNYVEEAAKAQGRRMADMTLGELDALWNEAKKEGK